MVNSSNLIIHFGTSNQATPATQLRSFGHGSRIQSCFRGQNWTHKFWLCSETNIIKVLISACFCLVSNHVKLLDHPEKFAFACSCDFFQGVIDYVCLNEGEYMSASTANFQPKLCVCVDLVPNPNQKITLSWHFCQILWMFEWGTCGTETTCTKVGRRSFIYTCVFCLLHCFIACYFSVLCNFHLSVRGFHNVKPQKIAKAGDGFVTARNLASKAKCPQIQNS